MDVVMPVPMASRRRVHHARRGDQAHPRDRRHEQEQETESRLGMRQGAKDYLMKHRRQDLLAKVAAIK